MRRGPWLLRISRASCDMRPMPSRRYAKWLWLLLAVFAFRVAAQPAALVFKSSFLPPFESWHGGVLPYGVLLGSQLLTLAVLGWSSWRFTVGGVVPRRSLGVAALTFGGVYFGTMALRLILGLTLFSDQRWFASRVPTFFHLVLAAFVMLFGHFHYVYGASRPGSRNSRYGKPSA
jgi:hypothetical protein